MTFLVRSPDELLAAMPHVLGFKPEESIVLIPFRPGLPVCRIDLPTTGADRDRVWDALRKPYSRYAQAGAQLAVICVTGDRGNAERASRHLSKRLEYLGITVDVRLWSDGHRWCELDTGQTGVRDPATAERFASTAVLVGAPQPAVSRTSVAAAMVGDREPIAQLLPAARAAVAARTPVAEREWVLDRVAQFHADGNRLSDFDGARILVALESIGIRDALWEDMSRQNVTSHQALWTDLTRRGPDQVRAAPASMLGFASWLSGDGAKAWCALDQVPADRPYSMAAVVASALQNAIHPREWDRCQARMRELTGELDESFVPRPPACQRDLPRTLPAERPAPGR